MIERNVKPGLEIKKKVVNDNIKPNVRIMTPIPPTRPMNKKTKLLTGQPISNRHAWNKKQRSRKGDQNGEKKNEQGKEVLKVGAWNMPVAATQPHLSNINLTNHTLEEEKLYILGIIECNIYQSTNVESLQNEGYSLEIGRGVEKEVDDNARVACYISKKVHYKRRSDLEEQTEMPTVWVEIELPGTKKALLGVIYREFKEWGGGEEDLKLWNQHARWERWLESLKEV